MGVVVTYRGSRCGWDKCYVIGQLFLIEIARCWCLCSWPRMSDCTLLALHAENVHAHGMVQWVATTAEEMHTIFVSYFRTVFIIIIIASFPFCQEMWGCRSRDEKNEIKIRKEGRELPCTVQQWDTLTIYYMKNKDTLTFPHPFMPTKSQIPLTKVVSIGLVAKSHFMVSQVITVASPNLLSQ